MRQTKQRYQPTYSSYLISLFRSLQSFYSLSENFRTFLITRPFIQRVLFRNKPSFHKRYLFTLIIFGIALLLRFILQRTFGDDILFTKNMSVVVFLLAVIFCAGYGGLGTGLLVMLLSVISVITINQKPEHAMSLYQTKDQIRLVFFIFFGLFLSLLFEILQVATRWQSIILESISDCFITFDRNMRFIYVNKRAEEVFKFQTEKVLGKRLVDIYPDTRKMVFYKHCRESFRKQKKLQFEMFQEQEGRWYSILLYPSIDGISAYFQDITRRKRIETKLRESQRQFQRLFDANIIGIFTADAKGNVYQANDLFLQIIGYTRADLKRGRINWKKMTPPEYQDISDRSNQEVLRKGMSPPFEKEFIRKDGSRVNILMGKVLLNKSSGTILTLNLDISVQKQLDKKKNEFISIASHELKTPLTTIKAFTQMLLKRLSNKPDKRTHYFLKNIDSQVNRLNLLVADLLDVSKMEAGKLSLQLKEFVLGDLVKKIIVDSRYTIQTHTIITQGRSRKVVIGDEHRIEQVLINLISNAVKYSPESERVIVTIADRKDQVIVGVRDFGIGIAEEEQKKVFERFFRSEKHLGSHVTGFGLGLYIAKEIIDRHDGRLWVESKVGKGSTFYFSLPAVREKVG